MPDVDPYGPNSVAVYRLYSEAGRLLYVGITDHPKRRFAQHAHDKPWWPKVATWTVTWFPDRAAAEAEETRAIREEVPAFNLAKVPDRSEEFDWYGTWAAQFGEIRPNAAHLAALFKAAVAAEDPLPQEWNPRAAWTHSDVLAIYEYARKQATPACQRAHLAFVEAWTVERDRADRNRRGLQPVVLPSRVWRPEPTRLQRAVLAWGRFCRRVDRFMEGDGPLWRPVRSANPNAASVQCTVTGAPIGLCGCHTRHVSDDVQALRFGRPVGTPIGVRRTNPPTAVRSG